MALSSKIPFEQLNPFQKAIWKVFEPIQTWKSRDVTYEFVFDTLHDQYQVYAQGWRGKERLYGMLIHLVIRGDHIWLEENNTELEVGQLLIAQGIPKDKIVLGFYPPNHRTLEGYAAGQ